MPKKFKLDLSFDNETAIVGISSHLKDYRLVWFINKKLGFKFAKTEDFLFKTNKPSKELYFSIYYFNDKINAANYYLLTNNSIADNNFLINEQKQANYILFCEIPDQSRDTHTLISDLKKTPNILTAFEINQYDVKNFNNIISDLELHINNIEKKAKEKKKSHQFL